MKFLILTKHRDAAPPLQNPLAANQAAKEAIDAALADGSMDCVYPFASGRRAVAIVNADSAEEVWEMITPYPLYPLLDYEVHPLVDVNYVFDKSIERMQNVGGG